DVQPRRRDVVSQPEPCDVVVGHQPGGVLGEGLDHHAAAGQPCIRPRPVEAGGEGLDEQSGQAGQFVESLELVGGHQAPTRFWPQTRTTWPVTPPEAGLASHAMVSATSTGCPPWPSELVRRKISRLTKGMAPVISVSMNPGATALTVTGRCSRASDSAHTSPMTPALDAA